MTNWTEDAVFKLCGWNSDFSDKLFSPVEEASRGLFFLATKGMFCKVEVSVICYLLILSPAINHADLLVKFVASVSSLFIQKTTSFPPYFFRSALLSQTDAA